MSELRCSPVVASETCSFDLIGARLIRDVVRGKRVVVEAGRWVWNAAFRP